MKLAIEPVTAALRAPFVFASGSLEARELLLVSLEDDAGRIGYGEAAPLAHYDGVTIDDCRAAIEDCRSLLADSDGTDLEPLVSECARRAVLPQAISGIDLALRDLAGKRLHEPIWRLLGASAPPSVEVNHTIAAPDRAGAAAEALAAREAGYGTVKLKVGTGDDAGRLAAVRAAGGEELAIRIDANGTWAPAEAAAVVRALAPAGIELCEEPVSGLEAMLELSRLTDVALAIDETAVVPGALERRVCEAVCLKLSRFGGIGGLVAAARRARASGYELYLASTLDGPLGIAAALHAAAAIPVDRACGLATLELFSEREAPLTPRHGRLQAPEGPGLGEGLLEWYR